jgi:hypothetical protein
MACLATALAACEASVKEGCVGGVCNTGGSGAGGSGAGNSGGSGGSGGDDTCAGVDRSGELPCEVRAVLEAKCWGCHGSTLANGAPFPLVTYADTQAEFTAGVVIWERMQLAVESGFMPLSSSADGPLTDDELDVLDDWFDACAPSAAEGCDGP